MQLTSESPRRASGERDWHVPDWNRERPVCFWDPGRKLLKAIRDYQKWQTRGTVGRFITKFCLLRYHFWSVVAGADIPLNCQIDGGLLLPHPNGVVCHPSAKIGANCLLFQQVTVTERVVIGVHVDIGAGAKIIGPLSIGDHARIGANAVVTGDIPAGCTAVGIPARVVDPEASQELGAAEDSATDNSPAGYRGPRRSMTSR